MNTISLMKGSGQSRWMNSSEKPNRFFKIKVCCNSLAYLVQSADETLVKRPDQKALDVLLRLGLCYCQGLLFVT